jgi:aubergine-like protein
MLKKMPISYYYILVNKKTTLKFFEKTKQGNSVSYSNPASGFVICDQVTDNNIFEFYMQPQVVTQGTATPTNYHVAYGNLQLERSVLDLTYGLCFVYANWQGPVRVPAPLKLAEKLSKMTAKITKASLTNSLVDKVCYL